ncbi:hypothetical protein UP10_14885 [Bradyrhizobium sp. LTSPM299]|nr:hypothetical protein UP10_14885 [Bradyrhizobium sp. LTSPM299]
MSLQVHSRVGLGQAFWRVLRLEGRAGRFEFRLSYLDIRRAADQQVARNVDLGVPQPDSGRALFRVADAADALEITVRCT